MEKQSGSNRDDNERYLYRSKESMYINSISGALRDSSAGLTCSSTLSTIFNDNPKAAVNIMSSLEKLCHLGMNTQELINTTNLIVKIDKELFASNHEQTSLFAYLISEIGASTKSSEVSLYVLKELVSNCEIDGLNNKMMHIVKALASASNVMQNGKQLKRMLDFMFSLRGYVVEKVNAQASETKVPRLTPEEVALGLAAISIVAEFETSMSPKSHLIKYFRNLKNYRGIAHQSDADIKALKDAYFVPNNELIRETLSVVGLNINAQQMEDTRNRLKLINMQPRAKVESATNAIKLVASATKSMSYTQWMCTTSMDMLRHDESRYIEAMRVLSYLLVSNNMLPNTLRDNIDAASGMPDLYFRQLVNGSEQLMLCGQGLRAASYASGINRIRGMNSATFAAVSDVLFAIAKNATSMTNMDIALISESLREMSDANVVNIRIIATSNALKQMISKDPDLTNIAQFIKLIQMTSIESDERFNYMLRNLSEPGIKSWKSSELQYIRTKFLENKSLSEQDFIIKMDAIFRSIRARK